MMKEDEKVLSSIVKVQVYDTIKKMAKDRDESVSTFISEILTKIASKDVR